MIGAVSESAIGIFAVADGHDDHRVILPSVPHAPFAYAKSPRWYLLTVQFHNVRIWHLATIKSLDRVENRLGVSLRKGGKIAPRGHGEPHHTQR